MIKRILLKSVVAEGFAGYKEAIRFTFNEETTAFAGDNAEGKSSIGEAIAWCFTGRNLFGKNRNINIQNQNSDRTTVVATFEDQDGKTHTLERRLTSSTTIKFNNKTVSQEDLDSVLSATHFLTSFNPMFFIELDPTPARKMVVSLLPELTKDDVLKEMTAQEADFLSNELFEQNAIPAYLKARREEMREFKEEQKRLQGYMDKLSEPIEVPKEVAYDETPLQAKKKELEEQLINKPVVQTEDGLQKELVALREKREHVLGQTVPEDAEIAQLQGKEREILLEKSYVEKEEFRNAAEPCTLENDKKNLLSEHGHLTVQYNACIEQYKEKKLPFATNCPTCEGVLKEDKIAKLKSEQEAALAKIHAAGTAVKAKMDEIVVKGKQLTEEIKKKQEADALARATFEKQKSDKLTAFDKQLVDLKERIQKLTDVATTKKAAIQAEVGRITQEGVTLSQKIQNLTADSKKDLAAFEAKLHVLRQEVQQLEQSSREALTLKATRDTLLKKEQERLADLEKHALNQTRLGEEISKKENQIFYINRFSLRRVELLHNEMKKYLGHVSIVLQSFNADTGEVKDCFVVKYDDKPIHVCSLSERMRAGLEISGMISHIQGSDYPLFLDNAESITSYNAHQDQVIEVRVVEGLKLSVKAATGYEEVPRGLPV